MYFLSYATADVDASLEKFLADLVTEVSSSTSLPAYDARKLRSSFQPGEDPVLATEGALESCRVFVAVLSPAFLSSADCAREWAAFARRARQDPLLGVVVVNWEPTASSTLPAGMEQCELLDTPIGEARAHAGVRRLVNSETSAEYTAAVVTTADAVVRHAPGTGASRRTRGVYMTAELTIVPNPLFQAAHSEPVPNRSTPPPTRGRGRVFICYRRVDSEGITGRLYDRLVARFGKPAVFKDVFSIQLGRNFDTVIDDALQRSSVMLVVIGDRWEVSKLDLPTDPVRREIERAMALGVPIVPLFVRGATMPEASKLPESLRGLTQYNGMPLREDPDFHKDVDRLLENLPSPARTKWLLIAAPVVVAIAVAGVAMFPAAV